MLNSPFSPSFLSRSVTRTSKLSFNSIIGNLEKTVSTINQVIPLYNQVKPLINSSKSFFLGVNNMIKKRRVVNTQNNNDIINVEIKEEIKKEGTSSFTNQSYPSKPFFI